MQPRIIKIIIRTAGFMSVLVLFFALYEHILSIEKSVQAISEWETKYNWEFKTLPQ